MDDVATWSVWHVGEIGKLGTVQAPHYAAAIKGRYYTSRTHCRIG